MNAEQIARTSVADLSVWIDEALHGRDLHLRANEGEEVIELLGLHRSLAGPEQSRFQRAVVSLVWDMAELPDSNWRGEGNREAGADLVFLLGQTCQSFRAQRLVEEMIHSGTFFDEATNHANDIHGHLLQALQRMGVTKPVAFWREQVAKKPGTYLALGVAGVLEVDETGEVALEFIREWAGSMSEEDRHGFQTLLYMVEDKMGEEWVAQAMAEAGLAATKEEGE